MRVLVLHGRLRQLFAHSTDSIRGLRWSRAMEEDEAPAAKRVRTESVGSSEELSLQQEHGASATHATPMPMEDSEIQSEPKLPKIHRRKCILLLSYNGKGYLGMQRNPGVRTIEEELLDALEKSGAIAEKNLGKIQFQRCARTDKGVSAARQLVSLKMVSDPSPVERLNEHLPPQIRIMGMKRVTKGFNSKNACSSRTYEYLLPTYAFAPFAFQTSKYRIDDSTISRVDNLLQQYIGTHNFHNFTSGKKFEEPSAQRHIISFQSVNHFRGHSRCGTCDESKEMEFITLQIKGQSFMIHQIRKMIGLVIAVIKGYTPEGTLKKAYEKEKVDIPRAPALGLLLDNVHYDGYNRRYGNDGTHEALNWSEYDDKVRAFKSEHIHQDIIDTEVTQLSMMQWLGSLVIHDFNQSKERLERATVMSASGNDGSLTPGEQKELASISNDVIIPSNAMGDSGTVAGLCTADSSTAGGVDESSTAGGSSSVDDSNTAGGSSSVDDSNTAGGISGVDDSSTAGGSAVDDTSTAGGNSTVDDSNTAGGSAVDDSTAGGNSTVDDSSTAGGNSTMDDSNTAGGSTVDDSNTAGGSTVDDSSTASGSSTVDDTNTAGGSTVDDSSTAGGSAVDDSNTAGGSTVDDSNTAGGSSAVDDSNTAGGSSAVFLLL